MLKVLAPAKEIGVSSVGSMVTYRFSVAALETITLGHILLGGLMAVSILIAIFSQLTKRANIER